MLKTYFQLLRIKHYIKNVLVTAPLVFSRQLFDSTESVLRIALAFVCFSLVASSVYIVNDIMDRHQDAKHPVKCKRPIANGSVKVNTASLVALCLFLMACVASLYLSVPALTVLVIYYMLNLAYCIKLKHIPVIEVAILASGFVFRILYGGYATGVEVSSWLYLTVLSGSFYLGLGKRRNELERFSGDETRKVLSCYNSRFLDRNMYMFMAATICFHSLWAMGQGKWAICSIPVVMIASMRYSLLIEGTSDGDPINVILKDKMLLSLVAIYSAYILVAIYVL
ncbi:MAG: decaprenyl-phosphate phosphoribosyltransferase [Akkermansia sp.]|nr:decaprenyl-phosphate phosphoribosyltransferase [Akkermansia sp.]